MCVTCVCKTSESKGGFIVIISIWILDISFYLNILVWFYSKSFKTFQSFESQNACGRCLILFFLFTFRLLSWLKNSVKYIDIINFLSFTCKFIIHNAFLSPLLLNNWLSVQTKFRIKAVTHQPLVVENPYSSDIAEFSANPAVCRWVKTCHLSWWRHEFYALRQGDTWPERKRNVGSPTLLLQKLGEHSFARNIGFNLNYFWKWSDQLHLSWTSQHVVVV